MKRLVYNLIFVLFELDDDAGDDDMQIYSKQSVYRTWHLIEWQVSMKDTLLSWIASMKLPLHPATNDVVLRQQSIKMSYGRSVVKCTFLVCFYWKQLNASNTESQWWPCQRPQVKIEDIIEKSMKVPWEIVWLRSDGNETRSRILRSKKLTTLGIPRRSPIQVLTEPDVA